jgi:hypothetical protein
MDPNIIKAGKALIEAFPQPVSVANYGYWTTDGEFRKDHNPYCHAGLRMTEKDRGYTIDFIINRLMSQGVGRAVSLAYFEWLFNYSHYKDAFISKDANAYLTDQYIAMSTNVPANLLAGAAIATRLPSEYPTRAGLWASLVEAGCHPTIAFFYAHVICSDSADSMLYYAPTNAHTAIDGTGNYHSGLSFIKGIMINPSKLFSVTQRYDAGTIHRLWGPSDPDPFQKNVESLINKIPAKNNGSNPFKKASKAPAFGGYVDRKTAIEYLTPLFNNQYEGVLPK